MPFFAYTCLDCGREFEIIESLGRHEERKKLVCPGCSSDHVVRRWSDVSGDGSRKS